MNTNHCPCGNALLEDGTCSKCNETRVVKIKAGQWTIPVSEEEARQVYEYLKNIFEPKVDKNDNENNEFKRIEEIEKFLEKFKKEKYPEYPYKPYAPIDPLDNPYPWAPPYRPWGIPIPWYNYIISKYEY